MTSNRRARWLRYFRKKSRAALLRYFYAGIFVMVLIGFGLGLYLTAAYARSTERLEIRKMSVAGLHRVSENEVLARVNYTPGTNLLRVGLDGARRSVEEIPWVRHATVQRVWPDEIVIIVVERRPIALARIDGEIYQVDDDGVILPTDVLTDTSSPVLDGLHVGDIEGNRTKIEVYLETVRAIGQSELSEVHVAESGEVSVVPLNNPVLIDLGTGDHRGRWDKYVRLRNQIREEYPSAFQIDLRFRDQIIIRTRENEPAGKIIWGEEKKLS